MFKRLLPGLALLAFWLCGGPAAWADATEDKGLAAFYAKDFAGASATFQQALANNPRSTFDLVMWLESVRRLDKLVDMTEMLDDKAQKSPNDAVLESQLAMAYMYLSSERMSAVTRGQEAFDKALAIDPNCSLAHAGLGLYYFTTDKTAKSKNQLLKALEVNPGDTMATERLGEILLIEEEKPELSIPKFKTVVHDQPNYPDGWFFLGMAQEKSKKTKDAEASYERAIALDPFCLTRSTYARVRVARLYQDGKRKDLAIEVLQELLKQRPDFRDAKQELSEIESGVSAPPTPDSPNFLLQGESSGQ